MASCRCIHLLCKRWTQKVIRFIWNACPLELIKPNGSIEVISSNMSVVHEFNLEQNQCYTKVEFYLLPLLRHTYSTTMWWQCLQWQTVDGCQFCKCMYSFRYLHDAWCRSIKYHKLAVNISPNRSWNHFIHTCAVKADDCADQSHRIQYILGRKAYYTIDCVKDDERCSLSKVQLIFNIYFDASTIVPIMV